MRSTIRFRFTPWSVGGFMSPTPRVRLAVHTITISGTMAATEGADTAAAAGSVAWLAAMAATEAADSFSATGSAAWLATMAATEGADTSSSLGSVAWLATMAATEDADTASASGSVAWTATMAATEGADVAAFAGTVSGGGGGGGCGFQWGAAYLLWGTTSLSWGPCVPSGVTGTMAATEEPDTASFRGSVPAGGGGADAWYIQKVLARRKRLREEEYKRRLAIRLAKQIVEENDVERLEARAERLDAVMQEHGLAQTYLLEALETLRTTSRDAMLMARQEAARREVEENMLEAIRMAKLIYEELTDEEEAVLLLLE